MKLAFFIKLNYCKSLLGQNYDAIHCNKKKTSIQIDIYIKSINVQKVILKTFIIFIIRISTIFDFTKNRHNLHYLETSDYL